MSAPTNHWKLGLFVVVGFAGFIGVLGFLGARSLHQETVTYTTFFDESVQGLDVGSPVKFRGVTIGSVAEIGIAPDRRHVAVFCGIIVSQLESLKLLNRTPAQSLLPFARRPLATLSVPADLRMQLGSTGLTGVKFISIDFFDIADNPPPVLPFPVPQNYIPAAPSTMKSLEDAIVKAVNHFPEIADQLAAVAAQVNHLVTAINEQKLPEQASATLTHAGVVLSSLQATIAEMNMGKLSSGAEATIHGLNDAVAKLGAMLTKMDGDKGLLASAQRATDSIGDLAGGARGMGAEMSAALRDVREAASSIQRLADALETDSDMLLKGRAKAAKR